MAGNSGGETAREPSALTPDVVFAHVRDLLDERDRLYLERDRRYTERFDAQEKAVTTALANAEKATLVAQENAEKWRAASNEWRAAMDDREKTFLPRSEANSQVSAIHIRLANLEKSRDQTAGKSIALALVLAAIPVAIALYAALVS